MNSAQRRKSKREYPHVINMYPYPKDMYFMHDYRVIKAEDWCERNCENGYRLISKYDHAVFKFAIEKDAVIFALKWL
jgi:hypothetical protein